MEGNVVEIVGVLPHWETDHTETDVSKLVCTIIHRFEHTNGPVVEYETGIRPGENNAFSMKVISAAQAWRDAGGVIPEYVPPTAAELREWMEPVTARQFRLELLKASVALAEVDTAISAIADADLRANAEIEWQHATQFTRTHPLVSTLSTALGFTDDEVDALWQDALTL